MPYGVLSPTILTCAAVGFANVESQNIVGYNSVQIQGTDDLGNVKWHLLGIQFQDVDSSSEKMTIKKALNLGEIAPYGRAAGEKWKTRSGNAPEIQIRNADGGYDHYYYIAAGIEGKTSITTDRWVKGASDADAGDTEIGVGDGIWFTAKTLGTATATITFAGQVKTSDTTPIEISNGQWNLVACPYPMEHKIKKLQSTFVPYGRATGEKWKTRSGNAPEIQIRNGDGGYDHYYYIAAGIEGKTSITTDRWVKGTSDAETEDSFRPGAGFWFMNPTGSKGTLTFSFGN